MLHPLMSLMLGSALLRAAAACGAATVGPSPGASSQFSPFVMPSLALALDAGAVAAAAAAAGEAAPSAWRVLSGFINIAADTVTVGTEVQDDSTAAWTAAITDGGGSFFSFGPGSTPITLASGAYGVTFDVATAPNSTGPPQLSTMRYDPEWTACGTAPFPEPPCALRSSLQPWAQFGSSSAKTVTMRAQITVGWARMTALDVVVTGGGACVVTVSAQTGASWTRVGSAPFKGGQRVPLRVDLDAMLTVTAGEGTAMLVTASNNCNLLVADAGSAVAARGDGVYGAPHEGGVALVGGVHSVPACASRLQLNQGRSAGMVTPASATAYVVAGWDAEARVTARFNLFMQPSTDSRALVRRVFPSLLTIPHTVRPAQTFVLTNVRIQDTTDPRSDYWNGLRTEVARALQPYDPVNMQEALSSTTVLQSRISLALALDYRLNSLAQLPVSVQTDLPDIQAYLGDIETRVRTYVNTKRKVTASGAKPVSCVEVLVYTKPNSDALATRGLIRDQYSSYGGSEVMSIGEVYDDSGLAELSVPALSSMPLIAASIASAVWAIILAGLSFHNSS